MGLQRKRLVELCASLGENTTLAEISLRSNDLDDRAAAPLAEVLRTSTSLTKVDLSYNGFGELAGRAFGDVLANNSELRDLSLKWNSLRALGCAALTEGLKQNTTLNKLDLGWNGIGEEGSRAIAEMLAANVALTHLDISHNRVNLEGAPPASPRVPTRRPRSFRSRLNSIRCRQPRPLWQMARCVNRCRRRPTSLAWTLQPQRTLPARMARPLRGALIVADRPPWRPPCARKALY